MAGNDAVDCVFCDLINSNDDRIDLEESGWVTLRPIGPISDGHVLIVPVRHVVGFDALLPSEAAVLPSVLLSARLRYGALDYNLGVNSGKAAGQTVFHLHVHLISREEGDVEDPRGGIVRGLGQQLPGSQFEGYLAGLREERSR